MCCLGFGYGWPSPDPAELLYTGLPELGTDSIKHYILQHAFLKSSHAQSLGPVLKLQHDTVFCLPPPAPDTQP